MRGLVEVLRGHILSREGRMLPRKCFGSFASKPCPKSNTSGDIRIAGARTRHVILSVIANRAAIRAKYGHLLVKPRSQRRGFFLDTFERLSSAS